MLICGALALAVVCLLGAFGVFRGNTDERSKSPESRLGMLARGEILAKPGLSFVAESINVFNIPVGAKAKHSKQDNIDIAVIKRLMGVSFCVHQVSYVVCRFTRREECSSQNNWRVIFRDWGKRSEIPLWDHFIGTLRLNNLCWSISPVPYIPPELRRIARAGLVAFHRGTYYEPGTLSGHFGFALFQGCLSSSSSFPRLPAYKSSCDRGDGDKPPIGVRPPMGPLEGCVLGWRVSLGLGLILLSIGLFIVAVHRDSGWLALFCTAPFVAGSLILLNGHYPCTGHPYNEQRHPFQHNSKLAVLEGLSHKAE